MKPSILSILCTVSLLTFAPPVFAAENDTTQELKVTQPDDFEKSCGPLSAEALQMRDIIHATQDVKNRSTMQSHGVTAAGALGSFLIGSVTGGIGLAVGGMLIDYNIDENADTAEDIQDVAQQRRSLMMGIYKAKGCQGPLEHAMQDPEEFDPLDRIASSNAPIYHAELRSRYNN